jgi:hypothetical protein
MRFFPRIALLPGLLALSIPFAAAQKLDCNPCNDHYGRVQIGTNVQRMVVLKNVGTKSLRLRTKNVNGAAFSFGNFHLPMNVGAGKSVKLPVIFAPTAVGNASGTVTITSDAKNPKLVIGVQGVGKDMAKGHLTVNPSTLDFGSVKVGARSTASITLSASGQAVVVSKLESDSSEFTLPGLKLPFDVRVGESIKVKVKFKPNASGTASAALTVLSNAADSSIRVPLTGLGVSSGSHSADLTWHASKDPVIGYNVYRGGSKGGPYTQMNGGLESSTNYTDSTVQGGKTYYFVVTAVSDENRESGQSNEVQVEIPNP